MASASRVYAKARAKLAKKAGAILADRCRIIIGLVEYPDIPCKFGGGSGNVDGAAYQIKFPWGSPAVIGAAVVVDPISAFCDPSRPPITLQLVEPIDSSTQLWQEWRATSGPAFGRVDVGL